MAPHHSGYPTHIAEAARLWAIRVGDASFSDWDDLTIWLENNPDHLAAYEATLAEESWASALMIQGQNSGQAEHAIPLAGNAPPLPSPANDGLFTRRKWLAWGGAMAASVAVFGGWMGYQHLTSPARQEIITGPGQRHNVQLADGSRIILNGDTRIIIDHEQGRHVRMDYGEALFEVVHNEQRPFVVMVGETKLLDAGTIFNVVGTGGALEVAVAEGAVVYQPGQKQILLNAGDALSRADAKAAPTVHKADVEMIGGWQNGLLQYGNVPLDRVARDMSRATGQHIEVAKEASPLRFTGTLILTGNPAQALARAAPLLGVQIEPDGKNGWRMTPADDMPR